MGGDFNSKSLVTFVEQMITDKGEQLGVGELENERTRLSGLLNDGLDEAMVNALPDDKAAELEKLLDEKGDEATENEITAIIYGSQNLINDAIEKTMSEFRDAYLRGEI